MAKSKCQEANDNFLSGVENTLNDAFGYPKGSQVLLELCEEYKGERYTVPSKTLLTVIKRNERIRVDFNGANHDELLEEYRRYGVRSRRHLNRIIYGK